jgi:hypothetical protein
MGRNINATAVEPRLHAVWAFKEAYLKAKFKVGLTI